jgi:hypothetical protein
VVLAIGLLPAETFAQGGLRSGSLPDRSPGQFRSQGPMVRSPGPMGRAPGRPVRRLGNSPRGTREDVFRARPWTYRPGRSQLFFRGGGGYYPYPYYPYPAYPSSSYQYYPHEQIYQDPEPTVTVFPSTPAEDAPAAPLATAPRPEPYVPGPPGPPKTFYIIPGCYLGDRRPAPESLAPGCSISKLRVIPPSS